MNSDKAYLLGLIIGGGTLNRDLSRLTINLPFRKWGEVLSNPTRAGQIATDILNRLRPVFEYEYGISLTYSTTPEWRIICAGDISRLVDDLCKYGVAKAGELRKVADITDIIPYLNHDNLKRQFIAGLADSVGSLAPSHRRFDDNHQIISFEFSGNNYKLVYQLCRLINESGCSPDQVLWNHPNQHSTDNPYYRSWKKGFKLRVLLDEYTAQGSFLFQAKAEAAEQNRGLQQGGLVNTAGICESRRINVTSSTVHKAEDDVWLPESVRGCHFIHHKHICAVLGCPHAPVEQLKPYLDGIEHYINPFPIICRETKAKIREIIDSDPVMKNRTYRELSFAIHELISMYQDDANALIWGEDVGTGYPINEVLQAIAYVSAGIQGNLFGTRVRGNFIDVINQAVDAGTIEQIKIHIPDKLTPMIVEADNYSAMVGPKNPDVYIGLISKEGGLKYKVRVIREEDLDG